jgi:hypothetical protein
MRPHPCPTCDRVPAGKYDDLTQTGTRHLESSSATRHKRTDWAETVGCLRRIVTGHCSGLGVFIPCPTGGALDERGRVSDKPDEDLGVLAAKQLPVEWCAADSPLSRRRPRFPLFCPGSPFCLKWIPSRSGRKF